MTTEQNSIDKLEIPIRLSFPVLSVNTFEIGRAESVFSTIAGKVKKSFEVMPFKKLPDPNTMKSLVDTAKKHGKQGVVVFDPYFFDRQKTNPETLPALKSSLVYLENEGVNYIIAGKESLSEEFAYHIDLPPMGIQEIKELMKTCESNLKSKKALFDNKERDILANYALGLSHTQMKNVFTYSSYLKYKNKEYLSEVRKEKAHILRDAGLDVLESINIDDVGGLANLKQFLKVRQVGWNKDLPVKGILLAGVPGGGKTLIAKAAANCLGTPLVSLNMNRFYSKYLGETERQFTRALKTIEQIAPVVVLIDEIEKYFGMAEGEHEVSKRLLGTFLTWLQERKKKIFIVATANRVHALPPELMRAGRWDRAFFIDLPTDPERQKIFEIHLGKQDANISNFDMYALLQATEGYTGAEIEQAVIDALYVANSQDTCLSNKILLDTVKDITPTSQTRRDDINMIRQLGQQGFYPANEVYNNDVEVHGRKIVRDEPLPSSM